MQLVSDSMYWLIAHRNNRAVSAFCRGISLNYSVFLYCFLKWKRDKILWASEGACFTLSFDCDYEEDVLCLPQILDMLERYRILASFACVGKWIEKFPEIHKSIMEKGHEIINHTYSHPDNEQLDPNRKFNELSWREKKEQIEKCHKACKQSLGHEPIGFRTPHFGRLFSKGDYRILKELGYVYSSSTIAVETPENGQPFLARGGIVEFPLSMCPRHPFSIFDSWHTTSERTPGSVHKSDKEFYKLFKCLVNIAIRTNSYISIYLDPQDIIKVRSFEQALKYLADSKGKIRVTTYAKIAKSILK